MTSFFQEKAPQISIKNEKAPLVWGTSGWACFKERLLHKDPSKEVIRGKEVKTQSLFLCKCRLRIFSGIISVRHIHF
ncbi:MAG: hypothetical protein NZZ60_04685 [Bacteroidia bacterium]|nr:hypothetical protein [Bacteroidia bacterium]MDW8416250.1 hypothetical protein [Bacteroidia bacterium]